MNSAHIIQSQKSQPKPAAAPVEFSYSNEENDLENRSNQSYKAFDTGIQKSDIRFTLALFEEFKKTVFTARPNIEKLYTTIGSSSFYSYTKSHIRENRNKIIKNRRGEFVEVVREHTSKVLGSAIADSVAKQLKTNSSVSTVQHFSPLSHPDSLNSILQNAIPYFGSYAPELENVIVFPCAGVSLNNTKFPRGHLFHTFSQQSLSINQFSFFGHTAEARPVIHHPPYTMTAIKESKNSLVKLLREKKLSQDIYEKINSLLDTVYSAPHPLSLNNYVDQLTITNYWLFKQLFSSYRKPVPSLVYLAQEKVVLDLLCAYHLKSETTIYKLLFDPKVYPLIDTYFEGITGAFSQEKGLGTYLFWGLHKESKYRVQLWREGNRLTSKDNSFSVELNPQAIHEAIERNELVPSVMLTFCVLALYYGLFLGGGYEQTYYLTQTKNSYLSILKHLQDSESMDACDGLITTNLVIPRPLLMYLDGMNDIRIPATGIDMLLYGDQGKTWGGMLEATKKVSMGEVIERTLPSIYREYCKDATNAAVFSKLTERDIEVFTGLDKKIPPLARIV